MMSMDDFEFASGSVPGHRHLTVHRGNQDAIAQAQSKHGLVAVICDGCSDGANSEVGAHILANIAAARLDRNMYASGTNWEAARQDIVRSLEHVLEMMGAPRRSPERRALIAEKFLATMMALVITPARTEVASIGDGWLAVNGVVIPTPKYPNNRPPYLIYEATESSIEPELLRWNVLADLRTEDLQTVIMGSDGLDDLVAAEGKPMPGPTVYFDGHAPALVPSIREFVENPRYYKDNPVLVTRRLRMIAGGVTSAALVPGSTMSLLSDDTTLFALRRRATPAVPGVPA